MKIPKMHSDVNPQILRFSASESAANTFTQKEIDIPVTRLGNGRLLVMNIISIRVEPDVGTLGDADIFEWAITSSSKTTMPLYNSGDTIVHDKTQMIVGAAGQVFLKSMNFDYNLSDGQGNGFLVANDQIYVQVQGTSQTNAMTLRGIILYTMREVSAEEFIGIVRS